MTGTLVTLVVFLVAFGAVIALTGRVLVPADHVGLVTRKFGGRVDPRFQRINPYDDGRGVQARTLLPNTRTWLLPGLYSVRYFPMVRVPPNAIGIVDAQDGGHKPSNRPGRHVDCNNFQDGQAFLLNGGERGIQAATLPGDSWYFINTELFRIRIEPRVSVPRGTIGLVRAKVGGLRPADRAFGRHVECDSFQNGQEFLDGGGEQGKQLAILHGGAHYEINTALFEVLTVHTVADAPDGLTPHHLKEIEIPTGYVGVVVTLEGEEPPSGGASMVAPTVDGHRNFRLPWTFLEKGGYRGVQEEILGEGTVCALNPWFVRVVLVPTRILILEWNWKTQSEAANNYDAKLEPIVATVQGYRLRVNLDQTLQIPAKAAPRLVSEFGGTSSSGLGGLVDDPVPVQRFVEKVLGKIVETYFASIATGSTVNEFIRRYSECRLDLTSQVRNALGKYGVEPGRTNLGEYTAEDPGLNRRLQEEANEQMRGKKLVVERDNVNYEDEIDEVRFQAERRRAALELKAQIDALGQDNVAMIQMIEQIAKMQVPDIIGGDIASYAEALPMPVLRDLITRLREMRAERNLPPTAKKELDEHNED